MDLEPGLVLVHGNRAEQLRDVLVAWLRAVPLDPLETECVLVQSNGIAQWLRLALADEATGCGIAAGLDFLLPSRFVWQAYRAVLGAAAVPLRSPLDKDVLVWRLMRLLPRLLTQPAYEPLRVFLVNDPEGRKRHQLCTRLADLYDQYQVYRADWLHGWLQGEEAVLDARGARQPLAADQRWQAQLWRALRADLGQEAHPMGRAAVHEAFMACVGALPASAARPPGLPRRILIFGVSAMPRQLLDVLAALGRWVQILVCVNNPCAHYWADILGDRELLRARYRRQRRRPENEGPSSSVDDADLHQQTQPLLASWGRQGRDFIQLLDDFDDPEPRSAWGQAFAALHQRIDVFEALPGATLLQQLQDDIRDLRPLAETRARWPALDVRKDSSIRFQVAHSAQREVEILHDQLLAAFAADPELSPRDVIVMVPDIEAYAPHIQAVFGLHGPDDRRHIPYVVADRGGRQGDPLVIVLEQLLSLPRQRLEVRTVLEWLDVPALRARFGILEDDLPIVRRWVLGANIRWGLNAAHRAQFDLQQLPAAARSHTWLFGLRRMLLGYASGAPDLPWSDIVPYDDAAGLQAGVVGALAHLIDTLDRTRRRLTQQATPEAWVVGFGQLLDDFFVPQEDADQKTLLRFRQAMQDWLEACDAAAFDAALPAAIAAECCLAPLDGVALTQRFFAGAVTFATLMPMRAIPFRHVCLLGMQDGQYPRVRVPEDFDLMAKYPRPGDRSRREDDRYLFLEALLSARDHLSISWVGRDILDNSVRPPSVLVAQLRDHLDRGWRTLTGERTVSAALTCEHPLQPFSARYFPASPPAAEAPWFTYAREWRVAPLPADGCAGPAGAALPVMRLNGPLRLEALRTFLRHPVKAFFRTRLRVDFDLEDAVPEGLEPYARDGLSAWQLRDELLDAVQGTRPDLPLLQDAVNRHLGLMRQRGSLASGAFGALDAEGLAQTLQPVLERYARACDEWPVVCDTYFDMESGVPDDAALATSGHGTGTPLKFADRLSGWRRNAAGDWARIHLLASNLVDTSGRFRLQILIPAWLEHLAAHAHGRPSTALVISPKGVVRFAPLALAAGDAAACWQALLLAWEQGMCRPLPVEAAAAGIWLRGGAVREPQHRSVLAAGAHYAERVAMDLYLRRSYPDFESLCAHGGFFDWAERLYGALADAIQSDVGGRDGR